MNMTPEQLEMLKRLKDPIDGYMGEWKEGDLSYSLLSKRIIFVDKEVCKFLKDPKEELFIKDNVLRIPSFCTPDGKRCLWGMLDEYKRKRLVNGNGYYKIVLTPTRLQSDKIYAATDPYTAVLKALCEQEGV